MKTQVKQTMAELKVCSCDACFLDACAIALNNLKPKYVTTTKGALMAKLDELQFYRQSEIMIEVTKAVMQVAEKPHHSA